jgi:excisionase family DNA binding protein
MSSMNPTAVTTRRLSYKIPTTAELLEVSEATVWRLIRSGDLKAVKMRGATRIR